MGAGGAAWVVLALSGAEPFRRGVRGGLAWWGATALMVDWHLGMVESEDGRPRALGPADALTLARAWLVPVAAHAPTPLVCLAAGASDVLDGHLARADEPTRIGRDLEGLVDAAFAVAALREHRVRQLEERLRLGDAWTDWGLVFPSTVGTPLEGSNVSKHFIRLLERAGLPRRRFHDMRHTCATLLLLQEVPDRVVMEILGHSQLSMTARYSHVVSSMKQDAAGRMEALLATR